MILQENCLMKREGSKVEHLFRGLTPEEIDVRIGTVGKNGITLLLYKDARCDMNILDSVFGSFGWQRKHEAIKDNLFCSVGIRDEKGEWVWKQDCGTESNTEKEKGEASDSFKRACFNWGIGRELYTSGLLFIKCQTEEMGNNKHKLKNQYDYYGMKVTSIEYDESTNQRTIVGITIVDKNGKVLVQSGNSKATPKTPQKAAQKPVARDNTLANEFISEDEINALQGEFKRTGIHEPVILKEYNLELLSEMRMGDFYDCIRKFEKYPTKKSNTGIK